MSSLNKSCTHELTNSLSFLKAEEHVANSSRSVSNSPAFWTLLNAPFLSSYTILEVAIDDASSNSFMNSDWRIVLTARTDKSNSTVYPL